MKNLRTNFFISFILIFILFGCAPYPITGHDLRNNPHGMIEFSVNEDHMTVYKRIMLAAQTCYGTRSFRVDGQAFRDDNVAEITLASINIVYIAALYISVKADSDNLTSIKIYYAPGLNNEWKTAAEDTKHWANGNTDVCRR